MSCEHCKDKASGRPCVCGVAPTPRPSEGLDERMEGNEAAMLCANKAILEAMARQNLPTGFNDLRGGLLGIVCEGVNAAIPYIRRADEAALARARAEERRTCVNELRDYAKASGHYLHPFVIAADFIDLERAERLKNEASR